jgi:hypothetical protein
VGKTDLTDDKTAACEARRWKKIAPDPELHRSAATDWTTDDQTELACSTSSEPISRADNDDDDDMTVSLAAVLRVASPNPSWDQSIETVDVTDVGDWVILN